MTSPRVAFAAYQTGASANGGIESFTQMLAAVGAAGRIVLTQMETPVTARWRELGADVHVASLPYRIGEAFAGGSVASRLRRAASLVQTNAQTGRLLRARGVHLLHVNDPSAFWHCALGAKVAGAELVTHVRDIKPAGEAYGRRWTTMLRRSAAVCVLSEEMRAALSTRVPDAPVERIHVVPSIVDFTRCRPSDAAERAAAREALALPADACVVLVAAGFNPKKNQLDFIRNALPSLRAGDRAVLTVFVGDFVPSRNPYAARCLAAAEELGLADAVRFAGYQADMPRWYAAADIIAVPTRYEGMARCMIEGMAAARPVVSFDVCSAAECLLPDRGMVVPQGDYAGFAEAVLRLAGDAALRERLAEAAAAFARRRFDAAAVVAQLEQVYRIAKGAHR